MKKIVYLPDDIAQVGKDYLVQHGYEVKMGTDPTSETTIKEAKDASGMIVRLPVIDAKIIDQLPNLKIIARHGVGYNNIDLAAAAQHQVWVTNTPLANYEAVAETVIGFMLILAKRLVFYSNEMRQKEAYDPIGIFGHDLAGKTVGIIGYGKIGSDLAKKLQAFDMEILVHDPFVEKPAIGKKVTEDELLERSDFVTLHLPENDQTRQSFGAKQFHLMKSSAYFINAARGALVNEKEMVEALKNKEIKGAALDVYAHEPLPKDDPLFQLDNVFLTPHIAANSVEAMDNMALDAAKEVDRVLSGEKPLWPVNHLS